MHRATKSDPLDFGQFRLKLPPLQRARVAGSYAAVAIRTAKEFGVDLGQLGRACDLGDLQSPLPEFIGVENYLKLFEAASGLACDPLFGLHVGERFRHPDLSGYGLTLMACPTFRELTVLKLRYEGLAHDLGRSEVIERDGLIHYRWHSPWDDVPGSRHMYESVAAAFWVTNAHAAGFTPPGVYLSFKHQPPAGVDLAEYDRIFAERPHFGAAVAEGVFPAAYLDFPVQTNDPAALLHLTALTDERLAKHQSGGVEPKGLAELRALVRQQMMAGDVSLQNASRMLGVSTRTLQRRLAEAGVSYSGLLEDVRKETVPALLSDRRMTLTDVAFLLGFSEQSTFNHAFRRWYGMTPGEWRASSKPD